MKRALRRHHRMRLITKRLKHQIHTYKDKETLDFISGSLGNGSNNCSCWMCGNPRKYFKHITRQERDALRLYIEGCEEAEIRTTLRLNQIRFKYM